MTRQIEWNRRTVLTGAATLGIAGLLPSQASAQGLAKAIGLSSILGKATDGALDKLAQPNAFYDDEEIRIGLPIMGNLGGRSGGLFGRLMNAGDRLGILSGVTRTINDAAGLAAGEAKPIFRDAINELSFDDAPGIINEADGGTQYLRASSNDRLHSRFEPLVDAALNKLGVYQSFDGLAEKHRFIRDAGLNRESINRSVTNQGLDGIFSYVGKEEREFRKNPVRGLGDALGGLLKR
uniref:DUF4197 domain-containing protein n=1 Tax=uncultured Erythrobacter sp. TaxID=263913 RepID=UPI002625DCE5|nr:DUF4197 domain-containing protein [uncultured Erythrobacter sp.]